MFALKKKKLDRLVLILQSLHATGVIAFDARASKRTNEGDIRFLKDCGLLSFVGARKNGHYVLTQKAKNMLAALSR